MTTVLAQGSCATAVIQGVTPDAEGCEVVLLEGRASRRCRLDAQPAPGSSGAVADALSVILTVDGSDMRCALVRRRTGTTRVLLPEALAHLATGVHGVVRWAGPSDARISG